MRIDIWANFKQYSFDMPEILTMDVGCSHFRCQELFDVIICDPPYGLRAAIRTTEVKEEVKIDEEEEKIEFL